MFFVRTGSEEDKTCKCITTDKSRRILTRVSVNEGGCNCQLMNWLANNNNNKNNSRWLIFDNAMARYKRGGNIQR